MTTHIANILLAHGSRDPQWKIPFETMARTTQQQSNDQKESSDDKNSESNIIIELAYMELCEPSLEAVCKKLSQQGITQINIYPVFFAAGRHLRIDVPNQLKIIEGECNIRTILHPPIGQEKLVQDAITEVIIKRME